LEWTIEKEAYPPILRESKVKNVGKCQYILEEKVIARETKSCPPILKKDMVEGGEK
jgi:hypothetical protein